MYAYQPECLLEHIEQWSLNEPNDLTFAQEYQLACLSFQLLGTGMTEWTKAAAMVENSTTDFGLVGI